MAQDTSFLKSAVATSPGAATAIISQGAPATGQFLVEIDVSISGTTAAVDSANMQMTGIAGTSGGILILPVAPGAPFKLRFIKTLSVGVGPTISTIVAGTVGSVYAVSITFTLIVAENLPDSEVA